MPGQVQLGLKTKTFNRLFNGPTWGIRTASRQLASRAKTKKLSLGDIQNVISQHQVLWNRLIDVDVLLAGIDQDTTAKDLRQFFRASLYSCRTVAAFNFLGFKSVENFGLDFASVVQAGQKLSSALSAELIWGRLVAYRRNAGQPTPMEIAETRFFLKLLDAQARMAYLCSLEYEKVEALELSGKKHMEVCAASPLTPRYALIEALNSHDAAEPVKLKIFARLKDSLTKSELRVLVYNLVEQIRRYAFEQLKDTGFDLDDWRAFLYHGDNYIRAKAFEVLSDTFDEDQLTELVAVLVNVPAFLLHPEAATDAKLKMVKATLGTVHCPELLHIFFNVMEAQEIEAIAYFLFTTRTRNQVLEDNLTLFKELAVKNPKTPQSVLDNYDTINR